VQIEVLYSSSYSSINQFTIAIVEAFVRIIQFGADGNDDDGNDCRSGL